VSLRRTIVVHTRLAGKAARVDAARASAHGRKILTMDQLAARLAGGFFQPIEIDALQDAVRDALGAINLGELERIKNLPGMVRAAIGTLQKVWRAGLDLASHPEQPRLKALRCLEQETIRRLPAVMKRPSELVELARARIHLAPAVFGDIEVHGHSEMSPCWRPLLAALGDVVPVKWIAGARYVPEWLDATKVEVHRSEPTNPTTALFSCANPQHEVVEALRWARSLLAAGSARPEEIAIAAAGPAELDDHMMALARDANLPIHFVHGVKAVTDRPGQAAAALADVLLMGLSQERVRRLFALLPDDSKALEGLPREWPQVLPSDAPLTTLARWQQALAEVEPAAWPDGIDRSSRVLEVLDLLAQGPSAAAPAGEKMLAAVSLALWQRALKQGPAEALPVTLMELRIEDGLEPATSIIWTSAMALASAPRPHVRLIALNAGRWPRRISEDRLIPDHVVPVGIPDPLPVADADRRDFQTIRAMANASVALSWSRRDVEGRLLGRSPLVSGMSETYLSRGRKPEHAASESDRLLARPGEFVNRPVAVSAHSCWQDWYLRELTPHDGLFGKSHPRITKTLARPLSATSLRPMLRDPIRYVWKYALGWKEPEDADEPMTLDALAFGNLVHGVLEMAVNALEAGKGFANADRRKIRAAVHKAVAGQAKSWETAQPVPPPVIWRSNLELAEELAVAALAYRFEPLRGQESWTEVPFGMASVENSQRQNLPWDSTVPVEIPGTGLHIRGRIDRLDLSGDGHLVRVIDYKTGRIGKQQAEVVISGGRELQRCLYAFAAKTLLKRKIKVEAALLFPRAEKAEESLFPLSDVDAALEQLASAIALARSNLENGLGLPGIDAADAYNELAFALPANASGSYLKRKSELINVRLGDAVKIWDAT
jgi:PD-(D/E)XK nuclease superfamily protein